MAFETDLQVKAYENAGNIYSKKSPKLDKSDLEFARYKQDCRKRALDLAEDLCRSTIAGVTSATISQEADKYYNWLISIPD